MEIVKQLNLNKTPQDVKNNSITFARNIKLSNDAHYLTNEESLVDNELLSLMNGERIVGIIPCADELVALGSRNSVYRIKETADGYERTKVGCAWRYGGGIIHGTYTYNVNNELIVAIAEYSENGNEPLKVINLDTCESTDKEFQYYTAPDVPIANMKLTDIVKGSSIPNGTYHFYIRYELKNEHYTKWFPIGASYVAANVISDTLINITQKIDDNNSKQHIVKGTTNKDESNNNLNFKFNISFPIKPDGYIRYEIGFILQTESAQVCKTWRKYDYSYSGDIIFDGINTEDYDLDLMLENTYNITNVKTICNYENRLYIANYNESDYNEDLSSYANKVKAYYTETEFNANETYTLRNTLLPGQIYSFFIHYVRKDGSHTNGFRISNHHHSTHRIANIECDGNTLIANLDLSSIDQTDSNNSWVGTLTAHTTNYRVCDIFNNFDSTKGEFGYYENNVGNKLFKAPDATTSIFDYIGVRFEDIEIPKGFVAAFITYEKLEDEVYLPCAIGYSTVNGSDKYLDIDNGTNIIDASKGTSTFVSRDAQHTLVNCNKTIYKPIYKVTYPAVSISDVNHFGRFARYSRCYDGSAYFIDKVIPILSDQPEDDNASEDTQMSNGKLFFDTLTGRTDGNICNKRSITTEIGLMINPNYAYYSKKVKTLIRFTGYITSNGSYTAKDTDFAYTGWVQEDENLIYNNIGIAFNIDYITSRYGTKIKDISGNHLLFTNMRRLTYSAYCPSLYSYKTPPEIYITSRTYTYKEGTPLFDEKTTTISNKITNKVIHAANLSDLYEYKSHYIAVDNKAYTNYNKDKKYLTRFTKSIRRSDQIADESVVNYWYNFRADNYRMINENKGNITNIVGVGYYLLVHTEHSAFIFNKDASLKTKDRDVQLAIPDAFDTQYQELITSDKGYAGLQDEDAWCLNHDGYFFFDNDGEALYNFDNGKFNVLGTDIVEFVRHTKYNKVRFATDFNNNRVLICFHTNDDKKETISYNLISRSYISTHDYYFDNGYNTKTNCYLTKELSNKIYTFRNSTSIGNYKELVNFTPIFSNYTEDGLYYSVVDVICNVSYEATKSLESISYILSELIDYVDTINQSEPEFNRHYSGHQLILYTDETCSKTLDINVDNQLNVFDNYKYPWFDKGKWNLNYFRNYIKDWKETDNINRLLANQADNQSLIYGKYIVARFIFDTNTRVKFENVDFNINSY